MKKGVVLTIAAVSIGLASCTQSDSSKGERIGAEKNNVQAPVVKVSPPPADSVTVPPSDSAAPVRPVSSADPQSGPPLNTCAPSNKIAARIQQHTGKRVEVVACRQGRFPGAGWAVASWLASENEDDFADEAIVFQHLLSQDGAQFVAEAADKGGPSFRVNMEISDLIVVDLNGDGTDEIVRFENYSYNGADDRHLRVFGVKGNELTELLSFQYSTDSRPVLDNDSALACKASVRISKPNISGKRKIVVEGELISGNLANAEERGCIIGHKAFEI